ncbi:MAG: hypothetical protein M3461_00770, partial [Pseudomonadota bacterium]|nr:hypothetical protein [Pseudomonadota bacterium]
MPEYFSVMMNQQRSLVLARSVPRQRALAIIDLCLFPRQELQHVKARGRAQFVMLLGGTGRTGITGEAYLRLRTLPGEQAQADWAHFGKLTVGHAVRPLMAFVMVL